MKKILKIGINIILIITIVFFAVQIYKKINDYKQGESIYSKVRDEKKLKYALNEINNKFKFWIKVDGTNIDYPVVQTDDNKYYLKHNFYNENSKLGCIFVDYQNNIDHDKNIVIYGHNMLDGSMFSALEKFKNKDFFEKNNKIYIERDGKKYEYEVFAVNVLPAENNDIEINFKNDNKFKEYINQLQNNSIYKKYLDVNSTNKIITLCTCSYEYKKARTIINARLVNMVNI